MFHHTVASLDVLRFTITLQDYQELQNNTEIFKLEENERRFFDINFEILLLRI